MLTQDYYALCETDMCLITQLRCNIFIFLMLLANISNQPCFYIFFVAFISYKKVIALIVPTLCERLLLNLLFVFYRAK